MACGHAKFTGEVGVCLATSGPGAVHLLNGLYDAKLDHQPVVAIVGQQARAGLGGNYQQEVDLTSAVQGRLPRVRARGDGPGADPPPDRPGDADRRRRAHADVRDRPQRRAGGRRRRRPAARARHAALGDRRRLPAAPRRSRTTPICGARRRSSTRASGSRCWSARARCTPAERSSEVAELLGAGVAKALLGKAALPDDLPWVTGSIGLLGTKPSWDMMMRLRHAADGRLELPVLGVPARGGPGARRADRPRRADARHPLPDGGQPRRRQRRDAAGADPAAGAQGRPVLAGADRRRGRASGGG